MSESDKLSPPKAPIAFRVGVVGHRPDRLPSDEAGLTAVRERLAEVLDAVADAVAAFARGHGAAFYQAGTAPILTAISPLAEGADRLFAEEALRLGYRLNCVMPFAQENFEHDFLHPESFEPRSLERFRGILRNAESAGVLNRFELNGRRGHAREAYEAAGRVVLNQSDLLVVVWDGGGANGIGGTADTMRLAIEFNVPTLWIDSRAPHGWAMLRTPGDLDDLYGDEAEALPPAPAAIPLLAVIAEVVGAELDVPGAELDPDVSAATRAHLEGYLTETRPRFNFMVAWKLFRDFMDQDRLRVPAIRVADFEPQIRYAFPADSDLPPPAPMPGPAASWINLRLRGHYAWSDKLADLYADAHRSAFVLSSLLSAFAVFVALVPVAGHFSRRAAIATSIVEVVVMLILVGMPIASRRGRWHQKWLEYRVLAELVRELRILVPLGGARPTPRTPAHLASYGDPTQSWMYWYARAIARAVGLPDTRVTDTYIADQLSALLEFVGEVHHRGGSIRGQLGFHGMNSERMERIHDRLHRLTMILFVTTIGTVGVGWMQRFVWLDSPQQLTDWMVLASACLPAMGTAFAMINNQGEFARLQRRARAMADSLTTIRGQVAALAAEPETPPLGAVTDLAAQTAAMMVEENTEWRIVVLDLPHTGG